MARSGKRAWVIEKDYNPKEARKLEFLRQKRLKAKKPLRGFGIVLTGKMEKGRRTRVENWLSRLGAVVLPRVSGNTDYLIIGPHYLGKKRTKIKIAQDKGIQMLTESLFQKKFKLN